MSQLAKSQKIVVILFGSLALAACSFAPKYERPSLPIPSHYKETGLWAPAKPMLETATKKEPWWLLFHDKTLNKLEQKVTCDNNNLKVALSRYQEARAMADITRSDLYPKINSIDSVARAQNSTTFDATIASTSRIPRYNTFLLTAILNYEVDAWGRVRNSVIASDSLARASAFDLAAIDLSLHAELAADYFELLGDDEAQRVLDAVVVAYEKALFLTRQRHQWGLDPEANVDEAVTRVENAKTLATDMRLRRAQMEHAIAVLSGENPSMFSIKPRHTPFKLVTIAPELPSTLLERRPDIAAIEQLMLAANASIGVARSAYFPHLNMFALIGAQSSTLSDLFKTQSLIWSLGPSTALSLIVPEINQVIFDGFEIQAYIAKAKASYFEAVNSYRQSVLTAFREVEDNLVAIRRLDEEHQTQTRATTAAKRALYQANHRYQGGLVTYLNVVISENEALQSELSLISIKTRRQLASVQLIKALGGGWHCGPIGSKCTVSH